MIITVQIREMSALKGNTNSGAYGHATLTSPNVSTNLFVLDVLETV